MIYLRGVSARFGGLCRDVPERSGTWDPLPNPRAHQPQSYLRVPATPSAQGPHETARRTSDTRAVRTVTMLTLPLNRSVVCIVFLVANDVPWIFGKYRAFCKTVSGWSGTSSDSHLGGSRRAARSTIYRRGRLPSGSRGNHGNNPVSLP